MKKIFLFLLSAVLIFFLQQCKKQNDSGADKVYTIGIVSFGPDVGADLVIKGILDGLKQSGYEEGKNLDIEKFHAAGDMANIPQMIKNADYKGYDVMIPMTTPVLAASVSSVKNTQMVFCYVYDPIAAGAGKSFTEHHPLVTGIGSFPPINETINFIRQIVPGIKRVGIIYNSSEANSRKVVAVGKDVMAKRGIELVEVTITGTNEISQAAQSLVGKDIQAVWLSGDNTVLQGFQGAVKEINKAKLPLIINDPEFVKDGALAAIGIGWYETGIATAKLTARILTGEKAGKIPFENVAVRKVVVNNAVAKKLGITFPQEIVKEAEQIN